MLRLILHVECNVTALRQVKSKKDLLASVSGDFEVLAPEVRNNLANFKNWLQKQYQPIFPHHAIVRELKELRMKDDNLQSFVNEMHRLILLYNSQVPAGEKLSNSMILHYFLNGLPTILDPFPKPYALLIRWIPWRPTPQSSPIPTSLHIPRIP